MGAQDAGDDDRFARGLFKRLPERYDMLAELLSMGQNRRWRNAMVDHIAPFDTTRILDVACGPAGVTLELARRTEAQIIGIDLTPEMTFEGGRNVEKAGMGERIQLVIGRAQKLPFVDAQFDALTFTYLLRYVDDPQSTLEELARVTAPGARVASLEFFLPPSRFWRLWWWGYTRIVLPVGGFVSGGRAWFVVGRFLGPNITDHYRRYPLAWTVDAWERAGFKDVGTRIMSLGGGLVMWGTRGDG